MVIDFANRLEKALYADSPDHLASANHITALLSVDKSFETDHKEVIRYAVDHLIERRLKDGGWGFNAVDVSRIPCTAIMIILVVECGLAEGYMHHIQEAYHWLQRKWSDELVDEKLLPFKAAHLLGCASSLHGCRIDVVDINSELFYRTIDLLMKSQLQNGAWTYLLGRVDDPLRLELSSPYHTAIILPRLIRAYSYARDTQKEPMTECIVKAARYLCESQNLFGCWYATHNDPLVRMLCLGIMALNHALMFIKGPLAEAAVP